MYKNFFNFLCTLISLLPLLYITSKYGSINHLYIIIYVIFMSINHLYMIDYIEPSQIFNKPLEDWFNVLFSDKGKGKQIDIGLNKEFDQSEINKSFDRIRDFIKITQKDGSGSYPEDFDFNGYKRDDGSRIHSKAPKDWGIDETYDFGKYSDLSTRKQSAAQMAVWLEYDSLVCKRSCISSDKLDPSLNSSGTLWMKDFCKEKSIPWDNQNTSFVRQIIRDISKGK